MDTHQFSELKKQVQIANKNGIDFILSAAILWLLLTFIWTLEYSSYNRSIFSFMVGALLLPMAFAFSKVLKTNWKAKDNPLQPLGLWLNFAQLIYFPFLIFILLKYPDYFIMTYAIITGAHFFPYAWLYAEITYAVCAIIISVGSLLIALNTEPNQIWFIPLFTSGALFIMFMIIYMRVNKLKSRIQASIS